MVGSPLPFIQPLLLPSLSATVLLCISSTYLLEVIIIIDVLPLMWVLQLVSLDILPQSCNYHGAGLSVNAKETGETRVQFVLWWLL